MKRNAIVFFEGKQTTKVTSGYITQAEELEIIPKDFEGDVIVLGDLSGYSIEVNGNLWVTGDLRGYSIEVNGDLWTMGKVHAHELIVDGSLYCYDKIDVNYIIAKEDITVYDTYLDKSQFVPGAWPSINAKRLDVGGSVECNGVLDVSDAFVEGDFCASAVFAYNISTGGDFTCTGNCSGDIKARGFFLCGGNFFGEIIS